MATTSPQNSRLRAAFSWWRAAAAQTQPPAEADFVTQDPQRYASLLSDAFIVDEVKGELAFRFIGTELSDYVGWNAPRQRLDLAAGRKEHALIRDALSNAAATRSPQLVRGRLLAGSEAASGDFEVICLPLTTSSGGVAFFGAVARTGHWKLPPAPQNHRIEVDAVLALETGGDSAGDAEGAFSPMAAAASPFPRGA